ncbi:hypothetical protein [Candidatus Entotheonella palauensis]|uniref:hypothetical protein n=1 Tax=Candidatus Entotheonella palauensis TaxID=93172 RepID=UPI000B7E1696|nr:hypothetical protein [Candidatus Entotheonella palauensis]
MQHIQQPVDRLIPDHLYKILQREFGDHSLIYELFDNFLSHEDYDRDFVSQLFSISKGVDTHAWEIRKIAMLMLEKQILNIPIDDIDEYDFIYSQLDIKRERSLKESLLKEGYSTTDLHGFSSEFRERLAGSARVHQNMQGLNTSECALEDFIEQSRQACKLSLARYLFTPDEVVAEILKQVRVSRGVKVPLTGEHPGAFVDSYASSSRC